MDRFEYVKCFLKSIDDKTPVLFFYEFDTEKERYATRMTEVYANRRTVPVTEEGFEFITEAPIPTLDEINTEREFYAVNITKDEFEAVYSSDRYEGSIEFPAKETR